MQSSRNEAADVTRAMAGDHDAFAALANANVDRLFALARVIVRDADRAEDATQEALVRAWRELPKLRDPARFQAWLRRLLVNACYDEGRRSLRSILPTAIIGVVLVGCAGASTATLGPTEGPASPSPTLAPASTSPTPAPTEPFALVSGALPPGRYTTTLFQPTLAFTLDDGWRGLFPDDDDEVALEGPAGVFFAISRVAKVIDPTTGTAVDAPDDLVEWLTTDPRLTAEAPNAVTVDDLAGQSVDFTSNDGREHAIFAFPTGNLRIPPGVTYRCYVVPLEGPDMTIIVGAPTAGFADAVAMTQPVIDSLVIDTSG
jgi:DNA-directed RNA polymerase specialized sigma24 family protein